MKKFFGTLFVALILTTTVASPAFAFGRTLPVGPAPIGRSAPAGLEAAGGKTTTYCTKNNKTYSVGAEYTEGGKTERCQPDGSWEEI